MTNLFTDDTTAADKRMYRKLAKAGVPMAAPPTADNVPEDFFNLEKKVAGYMAMFPNSDVERIRAMYIRNGCN